MKAKQQDQPTLEHLELVTIAPSKSNQLFRNPEEYTADALAELMASIQVHGVIQPITVRPDADGFELISGERRFQACKLLGIASIPAYIIEADDRAALEIQIIENLQRKDVNPMQEAQGFAQLIDKHKLPAADIARRIGKSPDYVQERVRLMRLIEPIQELVRSGEIPLKAGLKMARIPEELQKDALDEVTDSMDVDQDKGKPRRVTVFKGLEPLQSFMDSRLWCDLTEADFDKEDPTLSRENGKCSTCPHRTRNTGGLFDDLTNGEKCLLASCYRAKQVETYRRTAEQLKAKHPGREVIFREREGHVDGREIFKKELGELFTPAKGVEISEKEFKSNAEAYAAVLVGIPRWSSSAKKVVYLKSKEARTIIGEHKQKPEAENDRLRRLALDVTETQVFTQAIEKAASLEKLLNVLVSNALEGWEQEKMALAAATLGFPIPYKLEGKKAGAITSKTSGVELMEEFEVSEEDIHRIVSAASQAKKIAFILAAFWIDKDGGLVEQKLKLNAKTLHDKAGTLASVLVKEYKQNKAATPAPEGIGKGSDLAKLIGKKGGAKR